jgi:hypothetical protein
MGNDNHVVVSLNSVVFSAAAMKEPVLVAPKFQSFSLHILSQTSQYVTVKVKVGRSVRRNKFMIKTTLHVEKTMSMLLVELQICLAFFALGDCGLFHCDSCFVSGS